MTSLYRKLDQTERDHWLRKIVEVLLSDPPKAGAERHADWERGWAQHANATTAAELIPGYFGKYPVVRFNGELVGANHKNVEYEALAELQNALFKQYFKNASIISEFGCGTGHNLLRAHAINPEAWLVGYDWAQASQQLLHKIDCTLFHGWLATEPFNLFTPAGSLTHNQYVFTCAALEQVGENFRPFIDWLIDQCPKLVLHIEPIVELLDPTNLLDYLSIRYAEKRGYLKGLLPYLQKLEVRGHITIHEARRSGIGSLLLDGYQIVVWSPK